MIRRLFGWFAAGLVLFALAALAIWGFLVGRGALELEAERERDSTSSGPGGYR